MLCSDLEKTFIDCLSKPDYAGGIVEIARAIYISKEKIRFDTLLDYDKKFDSQAVIKRLISIKDLPNHYACFLLLWYKQRKKMN